MEERASSKAVFALSDQPRWMVGGGLVEEGLGSRCGDSGDATRSAGSSRRLEGDPEERVNLSVYLMAPLSIRPEIPPLVDWFDRRDPTSLRSSELVQGELSHDSFGVMRRCAIMSAASKGIGVICELALSFLPLPFLRDMT